ncbi:MAG: hypothetical protein V1804_03380 [Patescibacteria group bacterium]
MDEDLIKKLEDETKEDMSAAFLKAVSLALLEKLNDQDRYEYLRMVEEGADSEKLESFLREKIAEYDKIVEDISSDFK